jgi:hypothetical protein
MNIIIIPTILNQNNLKNLQAEEKQKVQSDNIFKLLIFCSRLNIDSSTKKRIEVLLQQEIDWNRLIEKASRHGVMPLLHKNLNNNAYVSRHHLYKLKSKFLDNLKKNFLLAQELIDVLDLFEQNEIPAIPFKGAILAISVYGNLSLRQFGDLDILVKERDFIKAKNLLIDCKYQPIHNWFLTDKQEISFIESMGEYSLVNQNKQIDIDLHSRLVAGYLFNLSANLDYFWSRLETVSFLDRQIATFQAEENLIYLCIHGTKSFWEKLIWICDVAELINQNPDLNWQYILSKAHELGCVRMLLLGCFLANNLLSTQLPSEVFEQIEGDRHISYLASIVERKLKDEIQYPCVDEYTLANLLFHIKAIDKLEDRLIYIWQYLLVRIFYPVYEIFRPTAFDRDFLKLPHNLYVLYYLIKPIRLVVQKIKEVKIE